MKKEGFTLIELAVSIVLVGVMLSSMIGTLVQLKNTHSVVNEDTDARVYGALVARVINNDFLTNNGVKAITCDEDAKRTCDIELGNNQKRRLEIIVNPTNALTEIEEEGGIKIGETRYERTTLRYTDTTESTEKLLYIKTIERIISQNDSDGEITYRTDGYVFTNITYNVYEYPNVKVPSKADRLTQITIGLSEPKYNIGLFSSGTYNSPNKLILNIKVKGENHIMYAGTTEACTITVALYSSTGTTLETKMVSVTDATRYQEIEMTYSGATAISEIKALFLDSSFVPLREDIVLNLD